MSGSVKISTKLYHFNLIETSRRVNAGIAALITNTAELDFAGNARLNKGNVDIGAYQSH